MLFDIFQLKIVILHDKTILFSQLNKKLDNDEENQSSCSGVW